MQRVLPAAVAFVGAYLFYRWRRVIKDEKVEFPVASSSADSSDLSFLRGKSFISVQHLNLTQIETIFRVASKMREAVQRDGQIDLCRGLVLGNLFYEPSTRTSSSFHTAMLRLGGQVAELLTLLLDESNFTSLFVSTDLFRIGHFNLQVLPLTDISNSSVAKGETLEDTVRCLQCYCDLLVQRHPKVRAVGITNRFFNIIFPFFSSGERRWAPPPPQRAPPAFR